MQNRLPRWTLIVVGRSAETPLSLKEYEALSEQSTMENLGFSVLSAAYTKAEFAEVDGAGIT